MFVDIVEVNVANMAFQVLVNYHIIIRTSWSALILRIISSPSTNILLIAVYHSTDLDCLLEVVISHGLLVLILVVGSINIVLWVEIDDLLLIVKGHWAHLLDGEEDFEHVSVTLQLVEVDPAHFELEGPFANEWMFGVLDFSVRLINQRFPFNVKNLWKLHWIIIAESDDKVDVSVGPPHQHVPLIRVQRMLDHNFTIIVPFDLFQLIIYNLLSFYRSPQRTKIVGFLLWLYKINIQTK